MAVYKLHIDEFDEVDYHLIAIHTSLEDYRLAYYLNQKLPVLLSRSKNEIPLTVKEGATFFSRFVYDDLEKDCSWNLIQNKNEVIQHTKENNRNLFAETDVDVAVPVFLLPEFKKVDYFLKIENTTDSVDEISANINSIARISTVYKVDIANIKSKNNLIF